MMKRKKSLLGQICKKPAGADMLSVPIKQSNEN